MYAKEDGLFRGEILQDINVEAILEDLGVEIDSENEKYYLVYCPYHNNHSSTAATIAKYNGFLYCWGAGCGVKMSLEELVKDLKDFSTMQAKRYIAKNTGTRKPIDEVLKDIFAKADELPTFPEATLEKMQEAYRNSSKAKAYIEFRKIKQATAEHFGIGYDPRRQMIVTPMRSSEGILVGVIGRTIEGKSFKNSKDLPSRKSLFGINIAKRMNSDMVVICESNFDAIRAWQSGYPAVATLGGTFSEFHRSQLNKYFNRIVLGIDGDEQGQKFASKIAQDCRKTGLSVLQARHSEAELFPHDAKDFGDCTDEEIAWMIRNADIYED